jgi:hypothetical protein
MPQVTKVTRQAFYLACFDIQNLQIIERTGSWRNAQSTTFVDIEVPEMLQVANAIW